MKIDRKKATALSAVIALALTGCSGATADESGKTTVSIWIDDNAVNPCFAETITSTFANDAIDLNIELKKDWDSLTKTAVAGGGGPDLIMTPGVSYTEEFAKAGALASLDSYSKKYGWDTTISPWALESGLSDGTLFSLQGELETIVLWYNKTVFDSLGLTPPTTTAELTTTANALHAAGIIPFAGANADWKGVNEWFVSAMFNAEAGADDMYGALTGAASFTDPGFVDPTERLTQWQQDGYIGGGLDRFYTASFDEVLSQFGAGQAGMSIDGSWRFENIDAFFTAANNEWDWTAFPTDDGRELFSIGTGSSWGINSSSDVQDESAAVLNHIFSPEIQAKLAVDCGYAPGPVVMEESMLSGLDPRQALLYSKVADASAKGDYGYLTWSFMGPKTDAYVYEEIEKLWAGSITAKQYLQGMQDLHDKELAAGKTPPIPQR